MQLHASGKALSAKRIRLRISFALARSTALSSGYVLGRPRLHRSTNSHEFTLSYNLGIVSFVSLYHEFPCLISLICCWFPCLIFGVWSQPFSGWLTWALYLNACIINSTAP